MNNGQTLNWQELGSSPPVLLARDWWGVPEDRLPNDFRRNMILKARREVEQLLRERGVHDG
jgi:hypothetical protein